MGRVVKAKGMVAGSQGGFHLLIRGFQYWRYSLILGCQYVSLSGNEFGSNVHRLYDHEVK